MTFQLILTLFLLIFTASCVTGLPTSTDQDSDSPEKEIKECTIDEEPEIGDDGKPTCCIDKTEKGECNIGVDVREE